MTLALGHNSKYYYQRAGVTMPLIGNMLGPGSRSIERLL